jgi:hypothetical protein
MIDYQMSIAIKIAAVNAAPAIIAIPDVQAGISAIAFVCL